MKRFFVRLAALSTLIALGLFAIASAKRAGGQADGGVLLAEGDDSEPHEAHRNYAEQPGIVAAGDDTTPAEEAEVRSPARSAPATAVGDEEPRSAGSAQVAAGDNLAPVDEAPASEPARPRSGIPFAPPREVPPAEENSLSSSEMDPRAPRRFAPVQATAADDPRAPAQPPREQPKGAAATAAPRAFDRQAAPDAAARPAPANDRAPRALAEVQPRDEPADDEGSSHDEGAATPGGRELEGLQTPALSIEKVAPPEIQVGKPAVFEIRVQNTGKSTARNVQIIDRVPQGTRLIAADPQADQGDRGELIWNVPSLAPGAASTVKIELMPLAEGTIGSVASVVFRADAAARTKATRPQLNLQVTGPESVMIGQDAAIGITVSNPGTGAATRVLLEADVPPSLKHPAGTELEFEVGTLGPGESRRLDLAMTAVRAGSATVQMAIHADGVAAVQQAAQFEIVAPQLEVAVEGPKRRFLDRKSTHLVLIANPGTAAAKDVELVAYLPRGMKFVEANNQGTYDASQHAVYWSLEELPAHKSGDVQLVTIPTEPGDQTIRVEGKAEQGLADQHEETISVEGVAALSLQIADLADPLEIGGQAQYEVRVVNSGSKSATNVRISAVLPAQMSPVDATGPTGSSLQGNAIVFDPIGRLAPKEEKVFRFRAEASAAGDLRVRVQLASDEMQQPVTQEESTRVFGDQ